jgi:hypothetical protein
MDVNDIHLDPTLDGNKTCNVSNNKTPKGKVTNQGTWELMMLTCHDDTYELSFSLASFIFHQFQLIK